MLYFLFQSTVATIPTAAPASRDLLSRITACFLPYQYLTSWVSLGDHYLFKWLYWDLVLVVTLMNLRIPGLRYGIGRAAIYFGLLALVDFTLLGKVPVSMS